MDQQQEEIDALRRAFRETRSELAVVAKRNSELLHAIKQLHDAAREFLSLTEERISLDLSRDMEYNRQ